MTQFHICRWMDAMCVPFKAKHWHASGQAQFLNWLNAFPTWIKFLSLKKLIIGSLFFGIVHKDPAVLFLAVLAAFPLPILHLSFTDFSCGCVHLYQAFSKPRASWELVPNTHMGGHFYIYLKGGPSFPYLSHNQCMWRLLTGSHFMTAYSKARLPRFRHCTSLSYASLLTSSLFLR